MLVVVEVGDVVQWVVVADWLLKIVELTGEVIVFGDKMEVVEVLDGRKCKRIFFQANAQAYNLFVNPFTS